MTREELRDYVEEQRSLNNIQYHVYSELIDGIDTLEQEPICPSHGIDCEDCPAYDPCGDVKTGHWIPVSERLPEDIKPVIVTWKNTDPKSYYQYIVGKHYIGTAHYKNGKWFWYSSVTEDLLAEYGRCDCEEFDEAIDVIAWMSLPKPFEPQESEEV